MYYLIGVVACINLGFQKTCKVLYIGCMLIPLGGGQLKEIEFILDKEVSG